MGVGNVRVMVSIAKIPAWTGVSAQKINTVEADARATTQWLIGLAVSQVEQISQVLVVGFVPASNGLPWHRSDEIKRIL